MTNKPIFKPSEKHPIDIRPLGHRATVTVAGQTIADSGDAIVLAEASYPPVIYFPRKDVKMELLKRSVHSSYCPYKGDASYFDIPGGGERSANAVWTYENPHESVKEIRDLVAFYPDRVDGLQSITAIE